MYTHTHTQDLVSKTDRVEISLTKMYESWLKLGKAYADDLCDLPYGLAPECITSGKRIKESKHPPKRAEQPKARSVVLQSRPAARRGRGNRTYVSQRGTSTEGALGPAGVSRGMRNGTVEGELQNQKICMKMPSEPITWCADF